MSMSKTHPGYVIDTWYIITYPYTSAIIVDMFVIQMYANKIVCINWPSRSYLEKKTLHTKYD